MKYRSRANRPQQARYTFWQGFLAGLSGPAMMYPGKRQVLSKIDTLSARSAWNQVGRYLEHGLKEERARVEKAGTSQRTAERA